MGQLFNLRGLVLSTNNENKQLINRKRRNVIFRSWDCWVKIKCKNRKDFLLDNPLNKNEFKRLNIDEKRYYLDSHHCNVSISPSVIEAINQSNIIIYAPGTQHSSLYPSYLSVGLAEKISENKNALKVFITNIGADYETPTYQASDYILGAYKYLCLSDGRNYPIEDLFNINLINKSNLKQDDSYVRFDEENFNKIPIKIIRKNYEDLKSPGKHDGTKIVDEILKIYQNEYQ